MRQKLRKLRLDRGISQAFIAKKLGFKSASGYSNIEMGRNRLYFEQAVVIANTLGVSMEDLIEDESLFDEKLHEKSKSAS